MSDRRTAMTALIVTFLLFTSLAVCAPKPKDPPSSPFHPSRLGDRWVYESRYQGEAIDFVEEVTKVETVEGRVRVRIDRDDGKATTLELSPAAITRVRNNPARAVDGPFLLLRFPAKVADQ